MAAVFGLFIALSLEVKAGNLRPNDLRDRLSQIVTRQFSRSEELPPIERASNKYPDVDFAQTALSDETLVAILFHGSVSATRIEDDLTKSTFFVSRRTEPAWRVVWNRFERPDTEVFEAISLMEKQFQDRAFVDPGVTLHVFGLRLWLASIGAINSSQEEVVEECKAYIEDVYRAGTVLPLSSADSGDYDFDSHDGLAFSQSDTPQFGELRDALRDARLRAFEDSFPKVASELIELLSKDPAAFARKVILNQSDGEYYRIPVLRAAKPEDFVTAVFCLDPAGERTVVRALRGRYEHRTLERELSEEKSWFEQVIAEWERRDQQVGNTLSHARRAAHLAGLRSMLP